MEHNPAISYQTSTAVEHLGKARHSSLEAGPAAIDPPAGRRIVESLSRRLPPPQRPHCVHALQPTRAQRRSGAYDALASHCLTEAHKPTPGTVWAYEECRRIIKHHSKSFYFSARLLPARQRPGIMALYAFCRLSDDLVDRADAGRDPVAARDQAREALEQWARRCAEGTDLEHPVVQAWSDTRRRFGIPPELPEELLAGIRMDLSISRYESWDELWVYCYRVASTVGLMSMYITGADTMEAIPYAVQLGVALQLTNILRDVGEDAKAGRIYIPAEDMRRFGYTEEMLLSGEVNRRFVELMDFQIARAHALYKAAWEGIAMLPRDSRLGVAAAATVYRGILGKIVGAGYDVFNHRAHLSTGEKVRALPRVWWRTRLGR